LAGLVRSLRLPLLFKIGTEQVLQILDMLAGSLKVSGLIASDVYHFGHPRSVVLAEELCSTLSALPTSPKA
jgi:hypothetical protein